MERTVSTALKKQKCFHIQSTPLVRYPNLRQFLTFYWTESKVTEIDTSPFSGRFSSGVGALFCQLTAGPQLFHHYQEQLCIWVEGNLTYISIVVYQYFPMLFIEYRLVLQRWRRETEPLSWVCTHPTKTRVSINKRSWVCTHLTTRARTNRRQKGNFFRPCLQRGSTGCPKNILTEFWGQRGGTRFWAKVVQTGPNRPKRSKTTWMSQSGRKS